MQKRIFPVFSILLLFISLVAPGVQAVAAAEKEEKTYEDGEYEVPVRVLHADKDESSTMQNYVKDDKTSVTIKEGKAVVFITLTSANMIKDFEVNNGNTKVENDNEDEKERTYSFTVNNIDEMIQGKVSVDAGIYKKTHDIRLQLDTNELPEVEDEKESDDDAEIDENDSKDEETQDGQTNDSNDKKDQSDQDKEDDQSEPSKTEDSDGTGNQPGETEGNQDKDDGLEDAESPAIKDGEYSIDLSVLHATKDEASSMGKYVENPVKLTMENGQPTISLTLKSSSMITEFSVESDGEFKETKTVDLDNAADKRTVSFKVDDLNEILNGKVKIDTKNPQFGVMTHDVRLSFDVDSIVEYEDEKDGAGDTESPAIKDGEYSIDISVLHATKDEASSMGRYVENPVKLTMENGQPTISLTLKSSSMITEFLVESDGEFKETKTINEDEAADKRTVSFKVADLNKVLNGKVKVDTKNPQFGVMTHDVRLSFDVDNIADYEGPIDAENLKDGTYSIDFNVLHETEDKASTAAGYIVKPAQLSVEDGVKMVYFLITDDEAIKDFKIEENGELKSATVVETDKENNTRLVAFEVEEFDTILKSQFKVSIPGMNYEAEPFARVQFNPDSIKKSDGELPEVPTKPELEEKGTYTMNMRVLEEEGFKKSPIGNYIKMPIDLTVKDGENIVLLTLLNSDKVKDFKIERKVEAAQTSLLTTDNLAKVTNSDYESVDMIQDNKDENSRVISFAIDDLNGQVNALVSIEEDGVVTDYPVRLFFEENSIRESDGLPVEDIDNPEKPTEPETPKEDLDPADLAEGVYKLDYTFLKAGEDEISSMDNFTSGPAYVKVDNKGNQSVAMTLTSAEMIKYFKVNDKTAKTLQEDKEEDSMTVEFPVKDLTVKQSGAVYVEVPGVYATEHEVDLVFDTDSLATANDKDYPEDLIGEQEPEEPENPGEGETPTKPEKPSEDLDAKNLAAGVYTLDYTFLEKGKDTPSAMDNFTSGLAYVKVDNKGNQTVAMTLKSAEMIKYFKVNGKTTKVLQEDEEEDSRIVEFPVKDLTKKQAGKVFVEVPNMYSTEHEVDLVFDTDTLATASEKDYPKDSNIKQQEPGKTGNLGGTPNPESKEPVNPELDPENLAAGMYQIDYTFLEKEKNTVSIMDGFTSGPANVRVDDKGNQFVAITFTSASYIKGFEVNGKSAKVLQADAKKDEMIVEFPVENLTKKQAAWVSVDVPGVYKTEHEVDLVFHTNTLDVLETYPTDEKPEQTLKSNEDPEQDTTDDQVPGFDRNADGTSGDGKASGLNPKTADLNMTQIILLALLLIGSMIPLMIKLRRKMAAAK